jgi:hypothetical protein
MLSGPPLDSPCFSEEQVLAFASGALAGAGLAEAERHADACDACRMLVAAYVRARSDEGGAPGGDLRMFRPGEVLANRYLVVRLIGEGGMGEVYEALDRAVGEKVALKTLGLRAPLGEEGIARCLAEMQLARRVTHRNVCRVFDLALHTERVRPGGDATVTLPLLTMELLAGESLGARIARTGPLPLVEVRELVTQMAAALDAAHGAGVVHLDFKCDNVMLVPEPRQGVRVVVTDFGLARRYRERSMAGLPSARLAGGTVGYMAPEQLDGERAGPEADIWALGVVIFEMLTGRRPFAGSTPLEVALQVVNAPPPGLGKGVPRGWERVVHRCLRPRPEERFRRAADLLAALEAASSSRRPSRSWGVALLGAATGVGALAGVTLWRGQADQGRPSVTVPVRATAPAAPSRVPTMVSVAPSGAALDASLPRPADAGAVSVSSGKRRDRVAGRAERARARALPAPRPFPASLPAPPPVKAEPPPEPGDDDAIDPFRR